ncbi:PadR family transcriptional regulator [Microbacterium sediminis]|uniref:PadR family transcriptional regulator n=1 Tax=Microbacterium sediminis TaxID=904291 RepID=A0A1B9N9K8_9MICO|nr:PadR family transcriptional regulator [Microbacterium sediminis]OCG73275.1 PadR family transcriptional regulator [Microbacterium sediminis]QBR75168.1 PadR family transcriptional regulator [Microbacterium sediminis]
MSLTNAVLGLLDLAPMSGYDLKKSFDNSVAHFWAADQAQIYRTLAKLVDDGAVEVTVIPQEGRPDRREHRITEAGRRALSAWLASPLDDERDRDPFLARVFFAGREGPEVARDLLRQRRALAEARLAALRAIPQPDGSLAERLRGATLRHGLRHLEAELAWLDEVEGEL